MGRFDRQGSLRAAYAMAPCGESASWNTGNAGGLTVLIKYYPQPSLIGTPGGRHPDNEIIRSLAIVSV